MAGMKHLATTVLLVISVATAAISAIADADSVQELALQAYIEGSGPPLVMLGGGTFGAVAFAPHAKLLAKDFRVIRLQTLNLERAQPQALPPGYSVKLESAAMATTLDRLKMTGPLDIVGWSFGGLVALDFALDHPERVRTLSLFEPPAFWAVGASDRAALPDLTTMIELTRELLPTSTPTDAQLVRFQCALGNCAVTPPAAGAADRQNWDSRRAALRGLSAVSNHTDRVARLRAFRRPVMIMTGSSTVPFHRRINEILAEHLPTVERAEVSGGHTAPVTAIEEFAATLKAFIIRAGG